MYWNDNLNLLEKDEKIVLANGNNGQWIRMSKEVYEIVSEIVNEDLDIENCDEFFENRDDYDFIKDIYNNLCNSRIILDEEEEDINKIASIQLTNRCNLHCAHCCVSAGDGNLEDLSLEKIKEIVDKVVKWNPKNIMLSGGEPLIYKDFFEVLSYLRNIYNGKIILSTNALLITEKNVDILVDSVDAFEISIDGVDEKSCSVVRGKGVFNKVCERIRLLQEHGAEKINLSMIFSDKTEELRPRFMELNERLGTTPVCRAFTPVGRGLENRKLLSNTPDDKSYIPDTYLDKNNEEPFGVSTCTAGRKELFINYEGVIYPCPSYSEPKYGIGNVLEIDDIQQYLVSKEYVTKKIRNNIGMKYISRCEKCDVRPFCWTCPGELVNINSEEEFIDRCIKKKPILTFRVWEKKIDM